MTTGDKWRLVIDPFEYDFLNESSIDMLNMLKEKTKGNLTPEETKLMEQMIYELQIKYVEKTGK